MDLAWIEPGTFMMGSLSSEWKHQANEGPQQEVSIDDGDEVQTMGGMDTDDDAVPTKKDIRQVLIEHLEKSKGYAQGGGEAHIVEIVTRAQFSEDKRLCYSTRAGMNWITEDDTDLFTAIPAFATSVDCVSPRAWDQTDLRLRGVLRFTMKKRTDGPLSMVEETADELVDHLIKLGLKELEISYGSRGKIKAAFFCPYGSYELFCITNYGHNAEPESALHAAAVLAGERCKNVECGVLECAPPFVNSAKRTLMANELRPRFSFLTASQYFHPTV